MTDYVTARNGETRNGCPICKEPSCAYWLMFQRQAWHPAKVTRAFHPGFPKPDDYLIPVWRHEIETVGRPGAIGLDPREALFVLYHGATINGHRYEASLDGWGPLPQMDGRVTVRLNPADKLAA